MFEFIEAIPVIGGSLATVIAFLIVLSIVVVIHELGHYFAGRWSGIHAEVFSLGFGPTLITKTDRRGTVWQIAAIPLGGYVKFLGDADGASRPVEGALDTMSEMDKSRTLQGASLGRRAFTVFAGPAANFILSIIVFAGLVMVTGVATKQPTVGEVVTLHGKENGLKTGDVITSYNGTEVTSYREIYEIANDADSAQDVEFGILRDGKPDLVIAPFPLPPLVSGVEPVSPASKAGLEIGDEISAINGTKVSSFKELREIVLASDQDEMPLTVFRDGKEIALSITPLERDRPDGNGGFEKRVMIGVMGGLLFEPATEFPGVLEAIKIGIERTWLIISGTFEGLYHMFAGNIGAENLQGPLGIAMMSGDTASTSLYSFIVLIATISTAIGLVNLFPIPVLDGGHLVFYAYEAIFRRPPNERVVQYAMSIGLSLLLMLVVFATYNDIMRL